MSLNKPPLSPLAKRHLQYLDSHAEEIRKRGARIFQSGTASLEDHVEYARLELREALDSLDPNAPGNGRDMDPCHAGCCVARAEAALRLLKEKYALEGS